MSLSKRFLSILWLALIACLSSSPAKATLLVMKATAEEVWFAADSRANISRGKETSFAEVQKIFELDNSCVFASTGLAGSPDGKVMAVDFARRKDTSGKPSPDERAHEYARTFSAPLKKILEDIRLTAPNTFFDFFLDKVAVSGMFVDYDKKPRSSVVLLLCHETSKGEISIEEKYDPQPTNFPAFYFIGYTEGATAAAIEGGRALAKEDSETQIQAMFDKQHQVTPQWVGPPYFMLTIDAKGIHWKRKPELHGTNKN